MKAAVVVGMHRSATSAVARGLHLAGFNMGDPLIPAVDSNPYGHFEHRSLVNLNDEILAALDATWKRPPPVSAVQTATEHVEACITYIERRCDAGQWGMKDPRLVLLWPLWRQAFDEMEGLDVIRVDVWRDPNEIAASLERRGDMSAADGLALALDYQDRMRGIIR